MAEFEIGDLVVVGTSEWEGRSAVVGSAISDVHRGQVFLYDEGAVRAVDVSAQDLEAASSASEGWAQLAHTLIMLGSHIIEDRLLVYRN